MFLPISHMPPSGIMRSVLLVGCSLARERMEGGRLPVSCSVWEMQGFSSCTTGATIWRRPWRGRSAAGFLRGLCGIGRLLRRSLRTGLLTARLLGIAASDAAAGRRGALRRVLRGLLGFACRLALFGLLRRALAARRARLVLRGGSLLFLLSRCSGARLSRRSWLARRSALFILALGRIPARRAAARSAAPLCGLGGVLPVFGLHVLFIFVFDHGYFLSLFRRSPPFSLLRRFLHIKNRRSAPALLRLPC